MITRKNWKTIVVSTALIACIIICSIVTLPAPASITERLSAQDILLCGLPLLYFFLAFLLITRRPLSATCLSLFVALAITIGNNFKYSVVSQPVVASDFILFGQVMENPVLFEKYLREQWYLLPLLLLLMALPFMAMRFERPLIKQKKWSVVSAITGVLLLWQIQTLLLKPQAPLQQLYIKLLPAFDNRDPWTAVENHGLFATLVSSAGTSYFEVPQVSAEEKQQLKQYSETLPSTETAADPLPNLVIILNEAFFDFRILDANFPASVYATWDKLKQQSHHGMATVDTYGGATLRTEFSVLTGVQVSLFGAEMDYPYLTGVNAPIASVPRHLKKMGYQASAIHPFHEDFWRRNLAYQWLGFDTFDSIHDFPSDAYDGPYLSDRSVCDKVKARLNNSHSPQFVFSVTMENHGPWSFDRGQIGPLPEIDTRQYAFTESVDLQLKRYIYHAQNAASMATCISDALASADRPGALLFLGDHAPAMPEVFKGFGVENPWHNPALRKVPYLIWSSKAKPTQQSDKLVSALPAALLKSESLPLDDFLLSSDYLREHCLPSSDQPQDIVASKCPNKSAEDLLLTLTKLRLHPL